MINKSTHAGLLARALTMNKKSVVAAPGGQPPPMDMPGMDPMMDPMMDPAMMDPSAGGMPPMPPMPPEGDPGMDPTMAAMGVPVGQPAPPMPPGEPVEDPDGVEHKPSKKEEEMRDIMKDIGAIKENIRSILRGQETIMKFLLSEAGEDPSSMPIKVSQSLGRPASETSNPQGPVDQVIDFNKMSQDPNLDMDAMFEDPPKGGSFQGNLNSILHEMRR